MEYKLTNEECNNLMNEITNDFNKDLNTKLKAYKEFVNYLADKAVGEKDTIIEVVNGSESIKFCGYIEIEEIINKKEVYFKFLYNDKTYMAQWQPNDNYAVYQRDDGCDCYYGFLLFPTYDNKKYFLMEYTR